LLHLGKVASLLRNKKKKGTTPTGLSIPNLAFDSGKPALVIWQSKFSPPRPIVGKGQGRQFSLPISGHPVTEDLLGHPERLSLRTSRISARKWCKPPTGLIASPAKGSIGPKPSYFHGFPFRVEAILFCVFVFDLVAIAP
jgi:hypothetical protein